MLDHFQEASRAAMRAKPQAERGTDRPVWGGPGWMVFLETRGDMERTMDYIERNPEKIRRDKQTWPFVKGYDGWLPGQVRIVKHAKPQAD